MKKTIFIITGLFIISIIVLVLMLINIKSGNLKLQQINKEYEYYLNREIYGTELATLINKAVDNNKRQEVQTDENGFYISNQTNSILITIQMLNAEEPYKMEKIFSLGTDKFVFLFNTSIFIGQEITYHRETGRIATMLFRQIE